jgi:hypothetical protein
MEQSDKPQPRRISPEFFGRAYPPPRGKVFAIFLGAAVAIFFLAFFRFGRDATVFSPGPLTSAHAMWNTNCDQCHQKNPAGGFFRTVSDGACLHCHSATIHSEQQMEFISKDGTSSANCTHCHMEHGGHDRLIDRTGESCVYCHGDILRHGQSIPANHSMNVTEFRVGSHPRFGLDLPRRQGVVVDPVRLVFDHKVHVKDLGMSCVKCHHLSPEGDPGSAPGQADAGITADGRFMQPVSFARDCASCHEIKFGDSVVPHGGMSLVREAIPQLTSDPESPFATSSESQDTGSDQDQGGDATPAKSVNVNDAAIAIIAQRVQKLSSVLISAQFAKLQSADQNRAGAIDPRLIQFYLFFTNTNTSKTKSCIACHVGFSGDVTLWPGTNGSTNLLSTLPTGLGKGPRQWYVNATFSHWAHRFLGNSNIGCESCHLGPAPSDILKTMLIPDIDSLGLHGDSCVGCHRPQSEGAPTAGAACLECHVYHDRRPPGAGKTASTQ